MGEEEFMVASPSGFSSKLQQQQQQQQQQQKGEPSPILMPPSILLVPHLRLSNAELEETDLNLKRQVKFLQQQVEEQALKFSVSQADSSFLTDVLAKKDHILQECQHLLVELDIRHHQLSTKNAELEIM